MDNKCKTCAHCKPTYKGYRCEIKDKKTKLTDVCGKWVKRATALLLAVILALTPLTARAEDTAPEVIMHEDWDWQNRTRPTQGFSEIFRATVAFKPTNVTAKANRNSITVTTGCNTAVRSVLIEYTTDDMFWWRETRCFRNVKYVAPVLVTRKSQQKYNWHTGKYSSSTDLSFTQGRRVLSHKYVYHGADQWGMLDVTTKSVNSVRGLVSFRKQFQLQNIPDCRSGYYVRVTYLYTSAVNGKGIRSISTTVKVR